MPAHGDKTETMAATPDSHTEVGSVRSGYKPTTLNEEPLAGTPPYTEAQTEKDTPLEVTVTEVSPAADAEDESEYPAAWKLGLITIALCLSVFCLALVRNLAWPILRLLSSSPSFVLIINSSGQYHYCYSHSSNYGSVSQARRCWLVWIRVPSHDMRRPAHLWQTLHLLLRQMGLHFRSFPLRSGLCRVRRHA